MKWFALFLVVGLCAFGSAARYYNFFPFDPPLTAACEPALKERLKAPSTYRRIAVSEYREPLSFEAYYAARPEKSEAVKLLRVRTATEKPVKLTAIMEYDASNSFGVALRSKALCTYEAIDGNDLPSQASVKIDGQTNGQLLLEQLTEASKRAR